MDRVVLITGASSGIGLETAKLFQSKNWKVAATMRTPEKAIDLANIVDLAAIRLDVTDPASIKSAIAETIEKFGRIDVVVNNAGYGLLGPFEAASDEQVRRQFETNLFGVMNVCREIIPYFREQKRGTIVNISSVGGRTAFPFSSLYHATKFAIEGFTESLQYELEPFGIRLKLVEPGPIKSEFLGRSEDIAKKDGLTVYESKLEGFLEFMRKGSAEAPDGSLVANKIYDAVTDRTKKLRYPVNTKGILAMRSLLPAGAFRFLTTQIFLK
ncbi:MAG TPA: SDR family oxidoreductase [Pyrinomonadaceae bacterium]|nr:SDR family oxidoreductase [Pyrinomonadaceae bacterium]